MTTKLFERLVTKFSIKVNDLAKYLEISKATIYNYRNLEKFCDIPSDKQYKIFYLFGKETEDELELVLDESDNDILSQYVNRISGILKASINEEKNSIISLESLSSQVEKLSQENLLLKRKVELLKHFENIDDFTLTVILDKVAKIVEYSSSTEIKQFLDYLEIFEKYKRV